jgi:hypothetical protein
MILVNGSRDACPRRIGWGHLIAEVKASWVHEFDNAPMASSGLPGGVAFTSNSTRPAADGARLTLAATLQRPVPCVP